MSVIQYQQQDFALLRGSPGTPGHGWQAVAAGGTSIGVKGMMVAAKTLALTGMQLFDDPSII